MTGAKKVLVAEDSSVVQNITKKVLQFQNYEITSVKNGAEVLASLEKEHYDIILLDIQMPVMDGFECAKRVRELPDATKANVPIVAITGNARNYSLEEYRSYGINEFLQKPINFDALLEIVRRLTGKD
jgi:CheY-like chemotaxis protein